MHAAATYLVTTSANTSLTLKDIRTLNLQHTGRHSMLSATCLAGSLQYHDRFMHTKFRNADTASGIKKRKKERKKAYQQGGGGFFA
jgi:hypothetical protein